MLLNQEVVLAYLDYSIVFESYTDASSKHLGTVITQDNRPIVFFSQNSPSHVVNTVSPNWTTSHSQNASKVQKGYYGASLLGWECCRHVADMSARQPNVGTFGQHSPVVPTQNWSSHSIFVLGMANIYPFLLLVPEVRMHNAPKTSA